MAVSRREFLLGTAAAGLGCGRPKRKRLYERKEFRLNSAFLIEVSRRPSSYNISAEETISAQRSISNYLLSTTKPGDTISGRIEIKAEDVDWIWIESDLEYANTVAKLAAQDLAHAMNFWKSPVLRKVVPKIVIPHTVEEIRGYSKPSETQAINLIYSVGTDTNIVAWESYLPSKKIYSNRAVRRLRRGEVTRNVSFVPRKDGVFIESVECAPLLYSLDETGPIIIIQPAVEILEQQLLDKSVGILLGELSRRANSDGSIDKIQVDAAKMKSVYREEAFANAIGKLWFERYNADANIGFTIGEIEGMTYGGGDVFVRPLALDIKRMGVQKAIEIYATRPDELFGKYGI